MPRQFVVISDTHIHLWQAFAHGHGAQNSRLRRSLAVLDASLLRAQTLGVPWVFGGDIVHTAGYTLNVVLAELTAVLARYKDVEKLAVWGNHDARGVGGKIGYQQTVLATLQRAVENLIVLQPGPLEVWKNGATGLTFSGAGYQPRAEHLEYAAPSDVGIYHQTVGGTKAPNGFELAGIDAAELRQRHRVSIVGHVHHWQYIGTDRRRPVLIPGSPEHHNFGDVGAHGWWVVTMPERCGPCSQFPCGFGRGACTCEEPQFEFVPGGSQEFRTVNTPADIQDDGHFYRVRNVPAGTALPDGAEAIAPGPTTVESRDVLRGATGDAVLEAWLRTAPPDTSVIPLDKYFEVGRRVLGGSLVGNLRAARLTSMRLRNFCSYADQEFEVRPGTWLVMGKGRDFPSNGAGKSSLFEAIFWALFGRTTKGLTGDEVIRWGEEACEVLLRFDLPNDDWLYVTRTRGSSSRLVVETSTGQLEGKSVNEVTGLLGQFLGITPELFQALGYFSQERLLLFASATDGERKDMLADLIGLTAYQDASASAARCGVDTANAATTAGTLGDAAAKQWQDETARLALAAAQAAEWQDAYATQVSAAEKHLAVFDEEHDQVRAKMIADATAELSVVVRSRQSGLMVQRNGLVAVLSAGAVTNTAEEVASARAAYDTAFSAAVQNHTEWQQARGLVVAWKQRFEQLTQVLAQGQCPSCGQPVSPEHREACLALTHADLRAAEAQEAGCAAKQPALEAAAAAAKAAHTAAVQGLAQAQRLAHVQAQLGVIEESLAAAESELASVAQAAAAKVDQVLDSRRNELLSAVALAKSRINPHTLEQAATEERIAAAAQLMTRHNAERAAALEATAIYAYWQHGFSKQGIQSLLLDEVAVLFNAARGTILPTLTQGVYDVQFSTVSQTKAGEWREKTEFQVFEHGQLVPYHALSGGQRRRVDVGVMLTLVKAVSQWMQTPGMLGILVLDEVFGFLDDSGAEGLMEALREVQEQVPSIFVISHEQQLQALFPEVIVVEQNEHGVSRVITEVAVA